jgi:GNAT superfamily N-acetyltransferase
MSSGIAFRAATAADAYALAELSILGGDGMYEFLLEDFAPREMLAGLMARSMKQDSGGCCWSHCFVAEDQGFVVGMINSFPAAWLREEERDILPQDRVLVLEPIDQAQDWQSFLVNGVAVRDPYRRKGIGTQLVQWAIEQAKAVGFARLSANVWEDNIPARAVFEKAGFGVLARVEVPPHPALHHTGRCLVMARQTELG